MKAGRFVIDTHVHAQRFAAGKAVREATGSLEGGSAWVSLSSAIRELEAYDNSARLLYDMDCYAVDACVLLPAFGMNNDLNLELVDKHPDRFVTVCNVGTYHRAVRAGELEWSIEGVCEELDRLLGTGRFVGIGEQLPYMPHPFDPMQPVSRETAMRNMLQIMEVARRHRVVVRYHTGCPMGYGVEYSTGSLGPANFNPLWAHDLAHAFPDVPIVFEHGGVQGWWSEKLWEDCLHVAASHDNVYLETGLWWTELYEKAIMDPNVGPEKLVWGTDWGASIPFHNQLHTSPPSYAVQLHKQGPVKHQVDFWGWSLRELGRLRVSQDDVNLIVGGNASRLFKLEPPLRRLFREPEAR